MEDDQYETICETQTSELVEAWSALFTADGDCEINGYSDDAYDTGGPSDIEDDENDADQ